MKQLLIITALLLGSISHLYSQETKEKKIKKYWNSLVNGHIDRTFEKKNRYELYRSPLLYP